MGPLRVRIWPAQAHVFPMFGLVPEARFDMVESADLSLSSTTAGSTGTR